MAKEFNLIWLTESYPKTFEKLVTFIIDTKLKSEIKKHNQNIFYVIVEKTIDNLLYQDFILFFDSIGFISQVSPTAKNVKIRFIPYIWQNGIEVYEPKRSYLTRFQS